MLVIPHFPGKHGLGINLCWPAVKCKQLTHFEPALIDVITLHLQCILIYPWHLERALEYIISTILQEFGYLSDGMLEIDLGDRKTVDCIYAILWFVSGLYPIYRSPLDITPVEHYFLWIIPLRTLLLCSMTHYDITMGIDFARDAHCNITIGNDIARDIHCDVTMSIDVVMCTSKCIITLL